MALPASFWEFLRSTQAQAVLWTTVLVWLVIIAFYVVSKVRGYLSDEGPSVERHLTEFRKMYEGGQLEDQEFRTIKRVLARQEEPQPPASGSQEPAEP
ncbi:MAG: hypothetical protein KatS3mg110_0960 [Pirellulaceae bacterium]|nr:MAG: hypothetical protein KatS3mg110_0960 [Pirellulaceae bacterium]